jgi:hypothetical protein
MANNMVERAGPERPAAHHDRYVLLLNCTAYDETKSMLDPRSHFFGRIVVLPLEFHRCA